jgi:hypothetical protein
MNIRPMFTADPSDRVRTASGSDRIRKDDRDIGCITTSLDPVASCTPREMLARGPRTARGSDTMCTS